MSADPNATIATETQPALVAVRSSDLFGVSSMTIAWKTPAALFANLEAEFGFTLDVCASDWNHQCERYYTVDDDGLACRWEGVCWCNPPFDATRSAWVEKAWRSAQGGCTVVMLLCTNGTTDTEWWHRFALASSEIRYLRGRPVFAGIDGKKAAMRCLLLVMRPQCQGPPTIHSVDVHGRPYKPNTEVSGGLEAPPQPKKGSQ